MAAPRDLVLILDFGGQYTQLIARRVREQHVYCEVVRFDTPAAALGARRPRALILSGGPASVYADHAPICAADVFRLGVPVLGICYGMQLMVRILGGSVTRGPAGEYGKVSASLDTRSALFRNLPSQVPCWMSHGDRVDTLPEGFTRSARTADSPTAAMENSEQRLYGVQFHPEVSHTPSGTDVLRRFLFDISGCAGDWTMADFATNAALEISAQIGSARALCALSGGVDSSVAAVLVHKAIGDRLTCVFVDTGLMRAGEGDFVERAFRGRFDMPLVRVDAGTQFLTALRGISDPEAKRKAIGRTFIECFHREARAMEDVRYLVQGTLYPDVIESGSAVGSTIKSHHNVGGLPAGLPFALVEPLRSLFKDEVRELGRTLGLPDDLVYRQPFPGPGLAVRVLGEVTADKVRILQMADAIVERHMRQAGWYNRVWQSFAVLPDIRTVGVKGDQRTYACTIALRVVESSDGMTANCARLPFDLLETIASAITDEVAEVNRVVYDLSSKPPSTIEWE